MITVDFPGPSSVRSTQITEEKYQLVFFKDWELYGPVIWAPDDAGSTAPKGWIAV